jgi:hypothetical protein
MATAPRRRPLRIATWNINSLRLRRPLLPRLIEALEPDVLCLQETKVPDELFPLDGVKALGFEHVRFRGMKGYNGVAILSRIPFVPHDLAPDWCGRGDCLAALPPALLHVPDGGIGSGRRLHLRWFLRRCGTDFRRLPVDHYRARHPRRSDLVRPEGPRPDNALVG